MENAEDKANTVFVNLTTGDTTSIGTWARCARRQRARRRMTWTRRSLWRAGCWCAFFTFAFSTPNDTVGRHADAALARIVSHRTLQCPPRRRAPSPARIPSGPISYLYRTASHPSSPSRAFSVAHIPSHPPRPIALSPFTRRSSPPDRIT
ncbi:hypothetical protein C8R44DRAFT_888529 [Mycena epipterygia]|nr:hypothetical protein C8R44DRAFT_888529 [Mycena epipterygia]